MTIVDRIGLALARPRRAFELAGDRRYAGRAGTDLVAVIAIGLVATQLRWFVSAAWLGVAVAPGLGLRAVVHVVTRSVTADLAALMVAALAIWLFARRARDLGRAFDLASVAVIPVVVVHVVAQVMVDLSHRVPSRTVRWIAEGFAYSWLVGLLALAVVVDRRDYSDPLRAAATGFTAGRCVGWFVTSIIALGWVLQVAWLGNHADDIRPLTRGAVAPSLSLLRIGPTGPTGDPVSLPPGKVAVLDFWATWCGPCIKGLPRLDAVARRHPEIDVFAINLDDPGAARALFDAAQYAMTLLADDGSASDRYGVTAVPHTVVIDRSGRVRCIGRGDGIDVEAEISAAAAAPLH